MFTLTIQAASLPELLSALGANTLALSKPEVADPKPAKP